MCERRLVESLYAGKRKLNDFWSGKYNMLSKIFYNSIDFVKFSFSFFRSMDNYVANKTILLADDEVDFCRLIGSVLHKQGFKVVFAHSLESAKFLLLTHDPAIILLDQNLPNGLGTEFIEKNRAVLADKHIILITADPSNELRAIAMKLGVFDFLSKPFQLSALNKMIYLAASF